MVARLSTFPDDVVGTPLAGLNLASAAPVVATDTVLVAVGKLQGQITALPTQGQVAALPTTAQVQRTSIVNALVFG